MHFHLPKPLHGWREFAGEVGIIVLGVLIALGAQQLVQDWSWHRDANDAQAAIMDELALDAGVYDERAIVSKCIETKGEQLSGILLQARQTGVLPDLENIERDGGARSGRYRLARQSRDGACDSWVGKGRAGRNSEVRPVELWNA